MGIYECPICKYAFNSTSIEVMPEKCPGCGINTNYNICNSVRYNYFSTIDYTAEKIKLPLEERIKKLEKIVKKLEKNKR